MFEAKYSEKAQEDIREITLWYNLQQSGLEDYFLDSLDLSIRTLIRNPYQYQKYYRHIRSVVLRRFPYRIIYKIIDDDVVIVGVFHTSRNPKTIFKRSKE